MIKGYTNAYRSFKNPHYKEITVKNASFLLNNQIQKDGSLYHSYKDGKSSITGFSEDYASVIDAFIEMAISTCFSIFSKPILENGCKIQLTFKR